MSITIKINDEIVGTISDTEIKIIKYDLPGLAGIKNWFENGPVRGKINNCKKRMFNEWIPKLREREADIPSSDEELVALIISQPDYKNRKQRDEEEQSQ